MNRKLNKKMSMLHCMNGFVKEGNEEEDLRLIHHKDFFIHFETSFLKNMYSNLQYYHFREIRHIIFNKRFLDALSLK